MAYIYRHIRKDTNVPFYIGIGSDETYRRANSKYHRNNHWKSITNITEYEVEILMDNINYEFAKEKEKEFIFLYGRTDFKKGSLCNKTDGGDGCTGLVHTEEAKIKVSKFNKGKIISEKQKESVSKFHKGKKLSQEHKDKISLSKLKEKNPMYGKKRSEEAKLKTSLLNQGELNKSSKITNEIVLEIRRLHKTENISSRKLSLKFNLSKSNILNIVNKKTWKHI
jgi:hypothetical protein